MSRPPPCRLVAFTGQIGAGKTTAAMYLVEAHGFERLRFAGPLKAMLWALGLDQRHTDGDLKSVPCALLCGRTPRHAMQTLGTEWRETIGRDLWTNIWRERVREVLGRGRVVVDDLRFEHEAAAVRGLGGVVVEITRPGTPSASAHASEALDFAADLALVNSGSPADLRRAIDRLLATIAAGEGG